MVQSHLGIKQDSISKITRAKKRVGGVAQVVSTCLASANPEFKYQYCPKKRKKEKYKRSLFTGN
jgi:hypothetical protein